MNILNKVNNTLSALISINSTSGREREILEFIEKRLRKSGFLIKRQDVDQERYNLIVEGKGETLISCHVDTVPPAGMKKPYSAVRKNGKIYGRGASDVKGPISCLLVAMERFTEVKNPENFPFWVAFVVDEEKNSALGSEMLAKLLKDKVSRCLVLEPTNGRICTSQMGSLEFTLTVKGQGSHASEFEKVENPARVLMDIISLLEKSVNRSVNVLQIRAGRGIYAVPETALALLEVKIFREEDWKEIWERLNGTVEEFKTGCHVSLKLEDAENFMDFGSKEFAKELGGILEESTGLKAVEGTMPSWTDAANYHKNGIKCVVFSMADLRSSHTSGECIDEADLERMTLFFLKMFGIKK